MEPPILHIFERFYRGDPSRARDTGGFGLGLALAKAFTEAYGGTIQLEAQVGSLCSPYSFPPSLPCISLSLPLGLGI